MLREVLRRAGYEVQEARDGAEGTKFYRDHPADLILTDLIMPEKEGLEIIQEFRRDHPKVKIIAMSGGGRHGSYDYLKIAKAFGAQQVLAKPFSHQEILETIIQVLEA
jgi:YesN/AraC family two-component response regulator